MADAGDPGTNTQNPAKGTSPIPGILKAKKVITLTLEPEDPNFQKTVYRLHKERLVIGTVVSADVRLVGEGISPIHAVLEIENPEGEENAAVIYDLASDTGVQVNGRKIVTQVLKPGDRIRIGSHELKLQVEDLGSVSPRERVRESEGRKLFLDPNEDLTPLLLEDERHIEEIFDYGPAQARALQVYMSWRGTILAAEHFVREKTVTVGSSRRSDFGIPPILSAKRYAIVTRSGNGFVLNIDPQMTGVIQRKKAELQTLDDVRAAAGVVSTGTIPVQINDEDFAKVSIGDVDFYFSYSAAPPRLKRSRLMERDPFFLRVFFSSLGLTGLMFVGLMNANVPKTLEAEQIPERIATILYQPEKYSIPKRPEPKTQKTDAQVQPPAQPTQPQEQKPVTKVEINPNSKNEKKPVPKEISVAPNVKTTKTTGAKPTQTQAGANSNRAQNEAKEGEGARAKGAEGSRGSKTAAPGTTPQDKASRPSPEGGTGTGGSRSQVGDEGNVDILKAATGKIENLLGSSTAQLGKGGEKLKGFGGFTTQGNGGLALSGQGKGGGGDAASLGGLSDKGRGGGKIGTGKGAAGNGSGIIGGATRVDLRVGGPEESVVMGSIDEGAIEAAILAHKDEFRLCYEKEINAENPNLSGRVSTNFVIGPSGRVTQAGVESTTLKNANTERCVLNVLKRIEFPIPKGAGIVQVIYPFKFNSVGR